jgi:predicted enzyme related to lactoylglutathione lyase
MTIISLDRMGADGRPGQWTAPGRGGGQVDGLRAVRTDRRLADRAAPSDCGMDLLGVRAVMAFVSDPRAAAAWWSAVTGVRPGRAGDFTWLVLPGPVELAFHPADDERNPRGGSPVIYWAVGDLDDSRRSLLAAGAVAHRGPLEIAPGRRICQLQDPFGTVFGLDGP